MQIKHFYLLRLFIKADNPSAEASVEAVIIKRFISLVFGFSITGSGSSFTGFSSTSSGSVLKSENFPFINNAESIPLSSAFAKAILI